MRSTPAMQCGVVAGGRAAKTNLAGDVLRAALLCSTGGGTVNLRDTETYKTPPPRGTSAHRQSKGQLHTQAKTRCSPNLEGPFAAGAAPPLAYSNRNDHSRSLCVYAQRILRAWLWLPPAAPCGARRCPPAWPPLSPQMRSITYALRILPVRRARAPPRPGTRAP